MISARSPRWLVVAATAAAFATCGGRIIEDASPSDSAAFPFDASFVDITAQPMVDASYPNPIESSLDIDSQCTAGPDATASDASTTDASHASPDGVAADSTT